MAKRGKATKVHGPRDSAEKRHVPRAVDASPEAPPLGAASRTVDREPGDRALASARRVVFLGSALDADEREESLREKRVAWRSGGFECDPYTAVLERLVSRRGAPPAWEAGIQELGCVNLPLWLRPLPPASQAPKISSAEFAAFTDAGGCLTAADVVAGLLKEHVLPDLPCLIAVDHSLAGGAITALADRLGPENLTVVVLDAHTDAIPVSVTADAIYYDAETNPGSHYSLDDPLLYGRADSYNASSFLHYLLESGIVLPRQLHLMGVADYPPSRAFRLEDPRMVRYTGAYAALKRRGVNILTRDDITANRARVEWALDSIDTPYLYVSVDLDVGAGSSLKGVRFRDRKGLTPEILESIAASLGRAVRKVQLVGLDISEIDTRTAGPGLRAPGDRTYDFACLFIEALLGDRLAVAVPSPRKGETCLYT
ncbi:MAG: arginase family protein [Thermoleophilia bacterium]